MSRRTTQLNVFEFLFSEVQVILMQLSDIHPRESANQIF